METESVLVELLEVARKVIPYRFKVDPIPGEVMEELGTAVKHAEDLIALDVLHRASRYLRTQYRPWFTPEEAKAHFDARAIFIHRANEILAEYGQHFLRTGPKLVDPSAETCSK